MYWSNVLNMPRIERATLDGASRQVIIRGLSQVLGLVIDTVKDRLFWTNSDRGRIESCDLDGLDRRDIVVGFNQPMGLMVFREHIYWTERHSHEIHQAHALTGANHSLVVSSPEFPLALTVFHTAFNSGSY